MVAFLAAGLRRFAIAILQPCQHRLADVNATVVDDVRLNHLIAVSLHYL